MDTIWSRPQEWVCACDDVLDIGWTDFQMCFASCVRTHKCYFGVMQSCHPYSSTTRWSPGKGSVYLCVCVCFWGAPWGEAGQSLPVAALGQGMAIQDTCLASGPNFVVAPFVFSPAVHTLPSPAIYTDPHFNPSVLKSTPFFVCIPIFATCFANCVCVSLSHSQSMSHTFPLYLSILARLYFFISCAVGGVKVGESHGTSEYINSHQKANGAEWRLGALSCEWHWAAVWVYHHSISARMSSGITHTHAHTECIYHKHAETNRLTLARVHKHAPRRAIDR